MKVLSLVISMYNKCGDHNPSIPESDVLKRAQRVLAGQSMLFGKRASVYHPVHWPSYYRSAKGVCIWDENGRRYSDFTMVGVGTCALGYSHREVDKAVIDAVRRGNMSTLNTIEEVDLAENLIYVHKGMDKVRFTRSGGEACSVAARIARAATGRNLILFGGYHGWHDWYLSALYDNPNGVAQHLLGNLKPIGIPEVLAGSSLPLPIHSIDEIREFLESRVNLRRVAAIFVEPFHDSIAEGVINLLADVCRKNDILLIYDEITSGFRYGWGASYLYHSAALPSPNMVLLGKTMSNGYPLAAILGCNGCMDSVAQTFISSTYWTERSGPAAAIAVKNIYSRREIGKLLEKRGLEIKEVITRCAESAGVDIEFRTKMPQLLRYNFRVHEGMSDKFQTRLTHLMLNSGYLFASRSYATIAHKPNLIGRFSKALEKNLNKAVQELEDGRLAEYPYTREVSY
jgi:glutamate-1-semialdehyde 2,1-aminomutase